jgi:hypothetical protein
VSGVEADLRWLSTLAADQAVDDRAARSLIADRAWQSRSAGDEMVAPAAPDSARERLFLAYFEGQRLRYDFKFEALRSRAESWLVVFGNDALILAFAGFAALGLQRPDGLSFVDRASGSANADRRSRHVCLHALWFASFLPDQLDRVFTLSNTMVALGEDDANVHYRRAAPLRKARQYDRALEEVDLAIAMLAPGSNDVHQDYVRERELINSSRDIHALIDGQLQQATDDLRAQLAEAQRSLADGQFKVVEILGLFIALVGFLVGTGLTAIKATGYGQLSLAMGLLVVGTIVFFGLLRFVVRPPKS